MSSWRQYLIFSDLDGTLLDKDTYDFSPAKEAISLLKKRQIPLILCSSKTRLEMEIYRQKMGLSNEPFIAENGGAIFLPADKFDLKDFNFQFKHGYKVIELGTPSEFIKKCLKKIKKNLNLSFTCLSEMNVKKIVNLTNLSPYEAQLAKQREYSEPLIVNSENDINKLKQALSVYNLNLTKGGRFYTVIGGNSKGKAVEILKDIYQKLYPQAKLISIGLGDSPNDLELLKASDIRIVVRRNADYLKTDLPNVYLTKYPGPRGWNETILKILKD